MIAAMPAPQARPMTTGRIPSRMTMLVI
jgi:hypothetical protein